MANPKPNTSGLKPFGAGPDERRNSGGKPVGSRNALQGDFMRALADDFATHGIKAIQETRENSPAQYVKIVASLMPKELEIKRPLEELSDDDLIAGVAALQSFINSEGSGSGTTH